MHNYNVGALSDWFEVQPGVLLDFEVEAGTPRRIQFEAICEGEAGILATTPTRSQLVALGSGLMSVTFSSDEPTSITFLTHKDARVWMRSHHQTQVIPESDEAPFTTIEPRTGPSGEMKRMMELVRLNELRNQQALEQARRRQDELIARLEEKENAATAKERGAPAEAASDEGEPVIDE